MELICDRCRKDTDNTIVSMFNRQRVCFECMRKERLHPEYLRARRAFLNSILNGDINFDGIGLPSDLEVRKVRVKGPPGNFPEKEETQ